MLVGSNTRSTAVVGRAAVQSRLLPLERRRTTCQKKIRHSCNDIRDWISTCSKQCLDEEKKKQDTLEKKYTQISTYSVQQQQQQQRVQACNTSILVGKSVDVVKKFLNFIFLNYIFL